MKYSSNFAQYVTQNVLDIPTTPLNKTSFETGLGIFFGVASAVAVLIIAISAIKMTLSRGNSDDVKKARDSIIYASVGLAIVLSGFVIVTFVVERL